MAKEKIKQEIIERNGTDCMLSNSPLPEDMKLYDVHRKTPRAKGGTYTKENTVVSLPIAHMKEHGIHRERTDILDELKMIIDDRNQTMKLSMKINNQILAYQRCTDKLNQSTIAFLQETLKPVNDKVKEQTKQIEQWVKANKKSDPLIESMLGVKGVGAVTIAYLLIYVDLEKADTASSLWAYCGYDKAAHLRKQKGVAGGGNQTLRTMLFNSASSFIKCRNAYRDVYDNIKARYQVSEVITETRIAGKTGMHKVAWKDVSDGHRHSSAMRIMIKHFLADFWFVARTLRGLPTRSLYVEEKLGHTGIIRPEERGWKF